MNFSSIPFDVQVGLTARATQMTRVTRAEHVAVYSVFVWDWLLTLNTERDLLSTTGLSPVKLAYVFCRYWPLVFHAVTLWAQVAVSEARHCASIFRMPLLLTTFNFAGAASVLLVRLYAFNGTRLLPPAILAAGMVGVIIFQIHVATTKIQLAPFAPACFPTDIDQDARWLSGYFLSPLIWDSIITLEFIRTAIQQRLRFSLATGAIKVFIDEGLIYYFAIATIHGINVTLSYQSDIQISGALVPFSMLLPNLLACRLVINLRTAIANASKGSPAAASARKRDEEYALSAVSPVAFQGASMSESLGARRWFTDSEATTSGFTDTHGTLPPGLGRHSNWDTLNRGATSDSSMIQSESQDFTLSFTTTDSSFAAVQHASLSTVSLNEGEGEGQVLLAPPLQKNTHLSPRLKLFAPTGSSSSSFPQPSRPTSSYSPSSGRPATRRRNESEDDAPTLSPDQRWPTDVHDGDFIDTPMTPLRQRLPGEGVSAVVERPRFAIPEGDHSRARRQPHVSTQTNVIGFSSTLSPRVGRGAAYPFSGFGRDDAGLADS